MERFEDRNVTAELAVSIMKENGLIISPEQAGLILDFLYQIGLHCNKGIYR